MQNSGDQIVIIGNGETAELAYEYFTCDSPHDVVAFSVEAGYLKNKDLFGLPVVPFEELRGTYPPNKYKIFVAVSYTQLNRIRTRLYRQAKECGYSAVSYVSSKAFVWRNAKIGENCFILEHNIIQYGVTVGNNVTMWGANHVGHRSIIRDNCFITGHVVISGYCEIGESCFLGANSCIGNNLKVADDCVVGAGAVVLHETEARKVYRGNPGRASHIDSFMAFNVKEK